MAKADGPFSKPTVDDWTWFALAIAALAMSLTLIYFDAEAGSIALLVALPYLVIITVKIASKRRFHRQHEERLNQSVFLPGGVKFSIATWWKYAAAASILLPSVALFQLQKDPHRILGALGVVGSIYLFVAVLIGPRWRMLPEKSLLSMEGFIQLNPPGITIGTRGFTFLVPWDSISRISVGKDIDLMMQTLLISLDMHRPPITAVPQERQKDLERYFATNVRKSGSPIVLHPSLYGLDSPLLIQTLVKYRAQPELRAELAASLKLSRN